MIKVLVLGAGAVGLGLSSFLLQSGCSVTIVGKKEIVDLLRGKGLSRIGIFGELYSPPGTFCAYSNLNDISPEEYDFILVCVKSFDSESVSRQLEKLVKIDSPNIVLFQNGWGNAEKFLNYFSKMNVFNARVITGFIRPEPNIVEVTVHAQPVHLGSLFISDLKGLSLLSEAIDGGGLPCEVTQEIAKDLWAKMLYNCSLNALGAILEVPYGSLGEKKSSRKIMDGIIEEVFIVMQAMGYQTHWQNTQEYFEEFYGKLLPSTYEHESSMLQDIRNGKKTEIESINGVIIEEGMKRNIVVPFNHLICNLIYFLQEKQNPS